MRHRRAISTRHEVQRPRHRRTFGDVLRSLRHSRRSVVVDIDRQRSGDGVAIEIPDGVSQVDRNIVFERGFDRSRCRQIVMPRMIDRSNQRELIRPRGRVGDLNTESSRIAGGGCIGDVRRRIERIVRAIPEVSQRDVIRSNRNTGRIGDGGVMHRGEADGRRLVRTNPEVQRACEVCLSIVTGLNIVRAARQIVLISNDGRVAARGRNVVLDRNCQRSRQIDAVAVKISCTEERGQIDRHHAGVAGSRRMIDLVEQREGVGSIGVADDLEHSTAIGRHAARDVVAGLGAELEMNRRSLRRHAGGRIVRSQIERERRLFVRTDRHSRAQFGCAKRHAGWLAAAFRIADRQSGQRVLEDTADRAAAIERNGNIILDTDGEHAAGCDRRC